MSPNYHTRDYLQAQTGYLFAAELPAMDDLRGERFRLLCSQLEKEFKWGWQRKYAKVFGLNQNHISQMQKQKRAVTLQTVEKVIEGMGIAREFFTDPSLGKSPDYHDFIGKKRATFDTSQPSKSASFVTESRTEYTGSDDYPTAEMRIAYNETEIGRHTHPDDLDIVLDSSYEGGPSLGKMMERGRHLRAQRAGKAVHEPNVNKPMGANKMSLGSGKKGR